MADTTGKSGSSAGYPDRSSFPVKFTVLVDAAVGGKSYRQRIFYHLLVQDRKGTRHTGADRAGVGIRCSAKLGGTAAENFGFGGQFYVNLQTNDGLILFAHVTVPPFLPVLPVPALRRSAALVSIACADDIFLFEAVTDQLQADGKPLFIFSARNRHARKACQIYGNRIDIAQIHLERIT